MKDGESSQPVVIQWKNVPSDLQPGDSTVREDNTQEPMQKRMLISQGPQIWTIFLIFIMESPSDKLSP